MTISQKITPEAAGGQLSCPHCHTALPPQAAFCGSCGERLQKKKQATAPLEEQDIQSRYRIKTLVRRYPHMNLYFALDQSHAQETGHTRMVAMRDIDIAGLEKDVREQAMVLAQQEYDCLRRWNLPHTLSCIDLRVFQGHLFLISGLPSTAQEMSSSNPQQRLYTLQDFLQSGLGLPKEARALEWLRNLCQAVEQLHRRHIILGNLDPYTVVLDKNSAQAQPRLMIFWLWPELQKLLPPALPSSTPQVSYFKAPEALVEKAGVRSDVYSLGALLYLLLTGTPPDESTLRHRRRLRTPREINSRISQHIDDCVMHALAVEPEERYPSVAAFLSALEDVHTPQAPRKATPPVRLPEVPLSDVETVRIVPLSHKDVERWHSSQKEGVADQKESSLRPERAIRSVQRLSRPLSPLPTMPLPAAQAAPTLDSLGTLPTTPLPGKTNARQIARQSERASRNPITPPPLPDEAEKLSWPQRISNILPAIVPEKAPKQRRAKRAEKKRPARSTRVSTTTPSENGESPSLFKQIQRIILGQQQHSIEAAAIIETPMRTRPDQPYNLRLHIMGRDEPKPHPDAHLGVAPAGLSALTHGELVLVEVRSVLQQGYTYILQKAAVTVPATGYAAEVTIPMQQQTLSTTGRRDRLHLIFLDEQRQPLYEKPFVIEIFVSPLVQFGREGHQVLTIPL